MWKTNSRGRVMDPAQPGFWSMDKNDDAYRTISEAAEELDLPQHVLRFWETRFPQIKPMKRGGGRRYYRPEDLELLRAIRQLLYGEGYTIKGVQRLLTEQGPRQLAALAAGDPGGASSAPAPSAPRSILAGSDVRDDDLRAEESMRPVLTATRDLPRHAGQDAQHYPQEAWQPQGSYLSRADLHALESALADLEECKRILDNVVQA